MIFSDSLNLNAMLKYLIKLPKEKEKLKDSTNTDDNTSTSTAKKLFNTDNKDTGIKEFWDVN